MGQGAAGGLVFGLPDALADDAVVESKVGVPSAILIIVTYTSSVVV